MLLVSTDPASNIHEVFGQDIGTDPTPITDVDGLKAMNVDPEAAAEAYRERVVGPTVAYYQFPIRASKNSSPVPARLRSPHLTSSEVVG